MEKVRYADILNGINSSWSIKEKAKYIYIQICRMSSYDERFIYSQNADLLKSIYYQSVNIDEYISPKLICKTMNEIYSELLNRVGIKHKIISKPSTINQFINSEDIALIFYDDDYNPYFTAIAGDIQRCKYGMKLQFFGGCDDHYKEGSKAKVRLIKAEENESIDIKIGYISQNGLYSDMIFDNISHEIKQNNELKKFLSTSGLHVMVDYLKEEGMSNAEQLSFDEIRKIIQTLEAKDIIKIKMKLANFVPHADTITGVIENKKFSIDLLKNSIFNKFEKKSYDCFDMVKEDDKQISVLNILRFNIKPEPIYYLYSEDTHKYELLSIEDALLISQEYEDSKNKDLTVQNTDDDGR